MEAPPCGPAIRAIVVLICNLLLVATLAAQAAPESTDNRAVAAVPACWSADADKAVRVAVVYHTIGGNTGILAQAVATGAGRVDDSCVLVGTVTSVTTAQLVRADAIILGAPVHNGNPSPQMLEYVQAWPFANQPFRNKIGAAFVTAGGISAGQESALVALLRSMLMFGMVVTGGEDWRTAFGVAAITNEAPFVGTPGADFLAKAQGLGQRVARISKRLRPAQIEPKR